MRKMYLLLGGLCLAVSSMAQTDTKKPAPDTTVNQPGFRHIACWKYDYHQKRWRQTWKFRY
jgi:hypothetical protein